jgi:hypothetical protein
MFSLQIALGATVGRLAHVVTKLEGEQQTIATQLTKTFTIPPGAMVCVKTAVAVVNITTNKHGAELHEKVPSLLHSSDP